MELRTERLGLRPFEERDREPFALLAADPRVVRFIAGGEPLSRELAAGLVDREIRRWQEHGFGWMAAELRETGEWIGFVGANHVPETVTELRGRVELGWWLVPTAWGRGLATEGAEAVRDDAFERLGLDELVARCQSANRASSAVMARLGMRFLHHAAGATGRREHHYALGRADWELR